MPWKELEKDTMEALMKSLLGKDESFVLERLQNMIKNEEKVKEQEESIRTLESEVLDSKEEIQYLRNKLDQKCDTIDDLEQEIEKIEKEVDEQKFNLKYQKNVMENKDRMISNLNEMREEREEKCSKLEHELNVSNTVLKELEDELEQKSNLVHEQEDVKELLDDIENLKHMNEGKELEIENMERENEKLQTKLQLLESKETEETKCLDEELGSSMSRNFKCKECDEHFGIRSDLKHHKRNVHAMHGMKMRLHELEIQILEQKLDVSVKIAKLKEAEQTCRCAGWCAINHLKHSCKKSSSKDLGSKFQKIADESPKELHTCNICEEKFTKVNHLETHMLIHENNYHECDFCKDTFSNSDDFVFHMENNHQEADVVFLDRNLHLNMFCGNDNML